MSPSQRETSRSISNFISIITTASEDYKRLTKQDLSSHPFATSLRSCESPAAILNLFREQAQHFDEFRKGDDSLMRWLDPTVNVLTKFSATIVAGIGHIVSIEQSIHS
jgi:hypothetical protein